MKRSGNSEDHRILRVTNVPIDTGKPSRTKSNSTSRLIVALLILLRFDFQTRLLLPPAPSTSTPVTVSMLPCCVVSVNCCYLFIVLADPSNTKRFIVVTGPLMWSWSSQSVRRALRTPPLPSQLVLVQGSKAAIRTAIHCPASRRGTRTRWQQHHQLHRHRH